MSERLSNASFTRTNGGASGANYPRFHMEPVQDNIASAAAGRPIYKEEERVEIIMPGNTNSPVLLVSDEHRQMWPEHYARFRKGLDFSMDGTPLEHWPALNRKHVLELKAMDLHTVEQCAAMSDLAIQKAGMGGRALRDLAKAYLDDAEATKITTEAIDRADRAEGRVANMQTQMDQMRERMDGMFKELMQTKNAPSSVDAFIPGDHDRLQALQAGNQYRPPQADPVAASSLDGLVHRGRGRPRKVDADKVDA